MFLPNKASIVIIIHNVKLAKEPGQAGLLYQSFYTEGRVGSSVNKQHVCTLFDM